MVNTNDYYWVTLTQKNMVTSDSNYNHFFWVVVTGQFLQCIYKEHAHELYTKKDRY